MPAGRPTLYDPKHGEAIIGYLREGYSITAAAGKLLVSRDTVYAWAEQHPEFSDALNAARAAAAAWWEDRLRDVAEKNEGNATAAIFGLKNRAAEEWRDKTETEHSGSVELRGVEMTFVRPDTPPADR
jgi:transposase